MKKTKIAVIGLKGLPAFGGAATVGESIISELKDSYEFTVLSIDSHTSQNNNVVNGVSQKIFSKIGKGGLNTFYYYFRCLVHVLFSKYDLIHLHHGASGFITPFLRLRYKVIVTFHGVFKEDDVKFSGFQNKFFRFSERLNIFYSNVVVSVSKPDKNYLESKFNCSIKYIPNGIKIEEYNSNDKINTAYTITFAAARIYHIKGLHILLNSLKMNDEKVKLVVIGDLNHVQSYKDDIFDMCKGLNVTFKGLLKNKKELFQTIKESDLFVFPSITEAMSMMLLEVASLKIPVIASDIDANKAVFSDREMVFFKSENAKDLSEKIKISIINREIMNRKANLAFEKVKENHSWKNIAQKYDELYKGLLN